MINISWYPHITYSQHRASASTSDVSMGRLIETLAAFNDVVAVVAETVSVHAQAVVPVESVVPVQSASTVGPDKLMPVHVLPAPPAQVPVAAVPVAHA